MRSVTKYFFEEVEEKKKGFFRKNWLPLTLVGGAAALAGGLTASKAYANKYNDSKRLTRKDLEPFFGNKLKKPTEQELLKEKARKEIPELPYKSKPKFKLFPNHPESGASRRSDGTIYYST